MEKLDSERKQENKDKILNFDYLNDTLGDNEEVRNRILELFLQQLPDFRKNITELYNKKNFVGIKEIAHKMKNSFEMVGAKKQASILKTIESLAIKQDIDNELPSLIDIIIEYSNIISDEIKGVIE